MRTQSNSYFNYPYGKVIREYVGGDKERYLTTQHERDAETGLDYRGARYYDSDVARFLSLDPHAVKKYTKDNPVYYSSKAKKYYSPDKAGHRADYAWKRFREDGARSTGIIENGEYIRVSE